MAKHWPGSVTRALLDDLDTQAQAAHEDLLMRSHEADNSTSRLSIEAGATYSGARIALAITQSASGREPGRGRETLTRALSVFGRP